MDDDDVVRAAFQPWELHPPIDSVLCRVVAVHVGLRGVYVGVFGIVAAAASHDGDCRHEQQDEMLEV